MAAGEVSSCPVDDRKPARSVFTFPRANTVHTAAAERTRAAHARKDVKEENAARMVQRRLREAYAGAGEFLPGRKSWFDLPRQDASEPDAIYSIRLENVEKVRRLWERMQDVWRIFIFTGDGYDEQARAVVNVIMDEWHETPSPRECGVKKSKQVVKNVTKYMRREEGGPWWERVVAAFAV